MKTVLFQAIQVSISSQFSSIWPIDTTLPGATTPGQSGPGSDSNVGIFRIPESSSNTRTSLSDCNGRLLPFCREAVGVLPTGQSLARMSLPLWICNSDRVCPPVGNSTSQFSIAFVMKFSCRIFFYIFRHSIIQVCVTIS